MNAAIRGIHLGADVRALTGTEKQGVAAVEAEASTQVRTTDQGLQAEEAVMWGSPLSSLIFPEDGLKCVSVTLQEVHG